MSGTRYAVKGAGNTRTAMRDRRSGGRGKPRLQQRPICLQPIENPGEGSGGSVIRDCTLIGCNSAGRWLLHRAEGRGEVVDGRKSAGRIFREGSGENLFHGGPSPYAVGIKRPRAIFADLAQQFATFQRKIQVLFPGD